MSNMSHTAFVVFTTLTLFPGWQARESPGEASSGSTNASSARKGVSMNRTDCGSYALLNGLNVYYEVHGEGKPLILLHGGVGGIEMMRPLLPAFANSRRVIAVELQGHGRTADIDRPLRYELMAEDIAALLKHLHMEKADIAGYSLGAGVALRLAFAHPDLVDKLMIISVAFKRDGWYPEVRAAMAQMGPATAEGMKRSPFFELYPGVDWGVLFTKLANMLQRDYDWSQEVAALKAPTLLVFADADSVSPAHIVEFYGLLGGGKKDAGLDGSGRPTAQLAILPGCTHYNIPASPALTTIVKAFLEAPAARR